MTDTNEPIVPEGILDTVFEKIRNLATWPFREIAVAYLKKDVSAWLKEATLNMLDWSEDQVNALLEQAGTRYTEFRETLEQNWDTYAEFLLYKLGFTAVPQGDGDAMVAFTGFPLETDEQETQGIFETILCRIVIGVLAEVISNFFNKK